MPSVKEIGEEIIIQTGANVLVLFGWFVLLLFNINHRVLLVEYLSGKTKISVRFIRPTSLNSTRNSIKFE